MQLELDFFSGDEGGFQFWRTEQRERLERLAALAGLPLGYQVELELKMGAVLRGRLLLEDKNLNQTVKAMGLLLRVGSAVFLAADVVSCVRT